MDMDTEVGNENTVFSQLSLPVELVSFESITQDADVHLSWSTATEANNAGFEIQRRMETAQINQTQETEIEHWEVVGFVEGFGTTTEAQSYRFVDQNLNPGRYQYRLKQVDYDGGFEFSPTVEVNMSIPEGYFLSEMYPNPFNPSTTFELVLDVPQEVRVSVYDLNGREVGVLFTGSMKEHINYRFRLDASDLSSGVYLVRVAGQNFNDIRKAVLMK
jgi:hypothetical protein